MIQKNLPKSSDYIIEILLYLVSGIIFSFGDMLHISFGIAKYSGWDAIKIINIPWWVPLEFSVAAFLLVRTYPLRIQLWGLSNELLVSKKHLIISFTLTLITYFSSSFLSENHFIIKNLFIFFILFSHITYEKAWSIRSMGEMISIGLSGCIFEYILGRMEIFSYVPSSSTIGSIPLWLFFIYMSVALTVRTFATFLKNL